jgi:hypothetical protein
MIILPPGHNDFNVTLEYFVQNIYMFCGIMVLVILYFCDLFYILSSD